MSSFEVLEDLSQLEGILSDRRISAKALGIFVLFAAMSAEDKKIGRLPELLSDGRESIQSGIAELESLGYLDRVSCPNPTGRGRSYRYFFNPKAGK